MTPDQLTQALYTALARAQRSPDPGLDGEPFKKHAVHGMRTHFATGGEVDATPDEMRRQLVGTGDEQAMQDYLSRQQPSNQTAMSDYFGRSQPSNQLAMNDTWYPGYGPFGYASDAKPEMWEGKPTNDTSYPGYGPFSYASPDTSGLSDDAPVGRHVTEISPSQGRGDSPPWGLRHNEAGYNSASDSGAESVQTEIKAPWRR